MMKSQMDPDRDFVYDVEASKLTFGGQVSYWLDKIMGYHVKAREIEQTEFIQVLYSNDKVPFEMRPKNVGTGVTYITELIIAALACKANDLLVIENPEIHRIRQVNRNWWNFLPFWHNVEYRLL